MRALKKLRVVTGGKERGNAAFSAGRYQEAYDEYSAAMAADPQLRTSFVAQVSLQLQQAGSGCGLLCCATVPSTLTRKPTSGTTSRTAPSSIRHSGAA
jgi:hypothetical protein